MIRTFDNTVARYRKSRQMAEELRDYAQSLEAECEKLEDEIVEHLTTNPEKYNVYVRKTSACGVTSRNMFTVTFSKRLVRRTKGKRTDDQDWLANVVCALTDDNYVNHKLELLSSRINADTKANILSDDNLKALDLKYERKASLEVAMLPTDLQISRLREEAIKQIESSEEE